METLVAIREVWPDALPLTVRLGVIEFGNDQARSLEESTQVLQWLRGAGLDLVDVGLAGTVAGEPVPWGKNFMVPYAARIRKETGLRVATSWQITDPIDANRFLEAGVLDLVMFARPFLANPHWVYQAAKDLGENSPHSVLPTPYSYWLKEWSP